MRTGLIPNRFTLPVIAVAPLLHLWLAGWVSGIASSLGLLVCGAVPWLFFRLGAMGGGDVKLFAALGAVAGPQLGLEVQLASVCLAFAYALVRMARAGQFRALIARSLQVFAGLVLPRFRPQAAATSELTSVRMGGAVFAATCLCVLRDALQRGLL